MEAEPTPIIIVCVGFLDCNPSLMWFYLSAAVLFFVLALVWSVVR